MQPKILSLICVASAIAAVDAWDINKSFPNCDAGEHGFSIPGIFTYSRNTNGEYVISGFQRSVTCDADICGCGVAASGSIIPPKYSSFACKGVVDTTAGKHIITFPPRSSGGQMSEPKKICCDGSFYGLTKAGCYTYT
jgi:hypothetical protein